MATLTIDRVHEMVSVSEVTRHLAGLLSNLRERLASKYFLTKNNTIEAVLLPIEEYEKLLDLESELDSLMLHHEITLRKTNDHGKRIALPVTADNSVKALTLHDQTSDLDAAYRALTEKNTAYLSLLATTSDGYWLTDLNGTLLDVNDAYIRQSGYSREELLSMNIRSLEAQESAADTTLHIQRLAETGADLFETKHRRKDGSIWDVEVSTTCSPLHGGQIYVFLRDISERIRVATEFADERSFLADLIEYSGMLIAVKDREGRYELVNRKWEEVTGLLRKDVLGKSDEELFPAPVGVQLRANDLQVIASGQCIETEESIADQKYGRRYGISTKFPLKLADGSVTGVCVMSADITERKQMEEEKLVLQQQLQQAQRLESLGVLAGGIAHDFNNILAIIIGNCFLAKIHPEEAENNISTIEKASERAAELCRQMLAYAGKGPFSMTLVNVGTLVDEMVTMLKATINQNAVITLDRPTTLPAVSGDASQLRQIVMNLIINAAEAIGDAQGEVRISLYTTICTVGQPDTDHLGKTITPGYYLCLQVSDSGCGMDDETMRKIFEPFFSTKFAGRGLGMSAMLGIISAHQGAVQLTSQPGQGTTVTVYLPAQEDRPETTAVIRHAVPDTWQASGSILLAEDERQLLTLTTLMLQDFGFTVIAATNGKEALELYRQHAAEITLVMTDVGMPLMDGYELFHELKKEQPKLPIIISSGFGDTAITARIPREEIAGLVSKPYTFDQLQEVVRSVVEKG